MMGLAVHRCGIGPAGAGLLLTDLVAHWDLSESSGTRYDSVSSRAATVLNTDSSAAGVGAGQTAYENLSASAANGLRVNHDAALVPSSTSIMCINFWIYRNTGGGPFPVFLMKATNHSTATTGGEYNCNLLSNSTWAGWARNSADTDRYGEHGVDAGPGLGAWTMATLVMDRVNSQIRLYENGSQIANNSLPDIRTNGTADLYLCRTGAGASVTLFAGRMQALSIWKGAGAQNAIDNLSWLYNSGTAARLYADLEAYAG